MATHPPTTPPIAPHGCIPTKRHGPRLRRLSLSRPTPQSRGLQAHHPLHSPLPLPSTASPQQQHPLHCRVPPKCRYCPAATPPPPPKQRRLRGLLYFFLWKWGRGANVGKAGAGVYHTFFQKMESIRFYVLRVKNYHSFSTKNIKWENTSFLQYLFIIVMIFSFVFPFLEWNWSITKVWYQSGTGKQKWTILWVSLLTIVFLGTD